MEAFVKVTPNAIAKVKALMAEEDQPDIKLRMFVQGGGCSGLSYTMDFDDQKTDMDDEVQVDGGLRVLIDRKSLLYLYGTTLTYSDGLQGRGFQWENPNASRTCGCGESFAL